MMKLSLDLLSQDLKILVSVIVMFGVSTQLFLSIISKTISKNKDFISKDYVSLHGFPGQSPTVPMGIKQFLGLATRAL